MYTTSIIREDFFLLKYNGKNWPTSANIFVIVDQDGLNLIDTGLNDVICFEGVAGGIQQMRLEISDIHTILLTHGHTDHIAGTNIISEQCNPVILMPEKSIPEATEPETQAHIILPSSVREIVPKLKDYDILGNFKDTCGKWWIKNVDISPVRDGDEIKLGKYTFQAIHVPGHDIGLMVFYEPDIKSILTTDLLRSSGLGSALPWYASTAGGVESYLKSLDKIKNLPVQDAFPSHGSIESPFTVMVEDTRSVLLEREAEIVASLKMGPRTCEQLDAALFSPFVLEICPWYSAVTESHLLKLKREGTVKRNGLEFILRRT